MLLLKSCMICNQKELAGLILSNPVTKFKKCQLQIIVFNQIICPSLETTHQKAYFCVLDYFLIGKQFFFKV